MHLTYVGPHDVVIIPLPLGGEITVKNGEVADIPDSLAKSLLEQPSNWKKAEATRPKPKE